MLSYFPIFFVFLFLPFLPKQDMASNVDHSCNVAYWAELAFVGSLFRVSASAAIYVYK